MIELFSRSSSALAPPPGALTRIRFDGEIRSLSAILLDDEYYAFLKELALDSERLRILPPYGLIALKAAAYFDLADRREGGEVIDARDMKKQRSDVFRMLLIVEPGLHVETSGKVRQDLNRFALEWHTEPFDRGHIARTMSLPHYGLDLHLRVAFETLFGIPIAGIER